MQIVPEVRARTEQLVAMRRELHANPELGLSEEWTSDFVARELEALGYEVSRGLAKTGVVATLRNGNGNRAVGIRADMDALPIVEETGLPYASKNPGRMHACGHDGHTAMLLGAARAIAERRRFDGTVHLIFQPAEENFGGGKIMVEEGLFDRHACDAVYALHNSPDLPLGTFGFRDGPLMAAADEARIVVRGKGGHGAHPEQTVDPVVVSASIVMSLQTIVSRNLDTRDPAVVTIGAIHGGTVSNIIPETVEMIVGIRSFSPEARDLLEQRIRDIVRLQAESFGATAEVHYDRSYDPTINDKAETDYLRGLAARLTEPEKIHEIPRPMMGSEDFGYMQAARPGSYFFLGAGRGGPEKPLHHPAYDFNDDLLPIGASFWTLLVEDYLRPASEAQR